MQTPSIKDAGCDNNVELWFACAIPNGTCRSKCCFPSHLEKVCHPEPQPSPIPHVSARRYAKGHGITQDTMFMKCALLLAQVIICNATTGITRNADDAIVHRLFSKSGGPVRDWTLANCPLPAAQDALYARAAACMCLCVCVCAARLFCLCVGRGGR